MRIRKLAELYVLTRLRHHRLNCVVPAPVMLSFLMRCGCTGAGINLDQNETCGVIGLLQKSKIHMSWFVFALHRVLRRRLNKVSDIRVVDMDVDMRDIHVVTVDQWQAYAQIQLTDRRVSAASFPS